MNKPFYWTAPSEPQGCDVAPTGWYQHTDSGLKYLGESILDGSVIDKAVEQVVLAEKRSQ